MLCNKSSLLVIIVVQWVLFTIVLYNNHFQMDVAASDRYFPPLPVRSAQPIPVLQPNCPQKVDSQEKWLGVAATLALRAPKWFHRRYTAMLYNVLDNTPDTWAVQVFIHPEWWNNEILRLHRGMYKLLQNPRVIVTKLPKQFWKHKPKQILMQNWFWEQMAANHVFLFSGNGVMCSHSGVSIDMFSEIDFCGVPANGLGGDGSIHSLRNRRAMLDAIAYGKPDMDIGSESSFFTSTLVQMNKDTPGKYRLASKNETILFGGGAHMISDGKDVRTNFEQYGPSLVMSGTGMNLAWDVRDALLQICPEWKLIFPSLHEPNCFGASPVADKCAASICALKPDRPKQGC